MTGVPMSTKTKKKENIYFWVWVESCPTIYKKLFINCLEGGDTMSGSEKNFL